jgi:2-succinyl-5-enolpyruvyl-6-hydroxy-3-cyclohexene-1-carboxylate synthase
MADAAAQRVVEKVLDAADGPTGLHVARALWSIAEENDLLFVASSRSIRDLEAVAGVRNDAPFVLANRGVNGIDGLVSTAIGAAIAHQGAGGGHAFAMLGDLALLYDLNGLLIGPGEARPNLTLIVVDNNGGGIFGSLEQADASLADVYERVFGTPQDVDVRALLAAHSVPVFDGEDLQATIAAASSRPGITAVVVGPVDRNAEAGLYSLIRSELQ